MLRSLNIYKLYVASEMKARRLRFALFRQFTRKSLKIYSRCPRTQINDGENMNLLRPLPISNRAKLSADG